MPARPLRTSAAASTPRRRSRADGSPTPAPAGVASWPCSCSCCSWSRPASSPRSASSAADPAPAVTSVLDRHGRVPVEPGSLPWPATGQAAVAIPSVGVDMASGPEQPEPVASLTKLMTAYVDPPRPPAGDGPAGTLHHGHPGRRGRLRRDTVSDDSNAQVAVGEQLPEVQVLGGLLIHSADNYADLLARWDAGSEAAFVAKMNADAAKLGMTQSHFADPSGVAAGSQSTPYDLLKVASLDMANPVFASLVRLSSITLPVAGTISTYTPFLGLRRRHRGEVRLHHGRRRVRRPRRRAPGPRGAHPPAGGRDRPAGSGRPGAGRACTGWRS